MIVPRECQPCFDGLGNLWLVLELRATERGLVVGVRPAVARRGSKVTYMPLYIWRRLFSVPDPPG